MATKEDELSVTALQLLINERDKRYEQRFLDLDKSKDIAFNAASLAISTTASQVKTAQETAFTAAEKVALETKRFTEDKLKSIDGLLEQTRQQAMTFIPHQEWHITVANFEASIKKLETSNSESTGAKSNSIWIIGVIIAIVAVIVDLLIRH